MGHDGIELTLFQYIDNYEPDVLLIITNFKEHYYMKKEIIMGEDIIKTNIVGIVDEPMPLGFN